MKGKGSIDRNLSFSDYTAELFEKYKKICVHTLRHYFVLDYYKRSGHDLIRLQKILGYKSVNTTEIYCLMDPADVKNGLKEYYSKLGEVDKTALKDRIQQFEKELRKIKGEMQVVLSRNLMIFFPTDGGENLE